MANDLTLGLRIRVNSDGSVHLLDQVGNSVHNISNNANAASQSVSALGGKMLAFASIAAAAVGGLSFAQAVHEIGSFETRMINVSALTGATAAEMAVMTAQARELGATTAFSAQEAAEAMGVLASAGLRTNEILDATPQVLQLAAAGSLGLAQAGEIAMGTVKGLGLELSDLGHINDVLAKTAGDTQSSVSDLGAALTQVAPLARLSGIGVDELSASLGTLANNNIKGATAGDQFKSMLAKLSDVTKPTITVLDKYGLTIQDINVSSRGLSAVMHTLQNANLSVADTFQLFGTEAGAVGAILTKSAADVDTLTQSLKNSEGAADNLASKMSQGLEKELDALQGTISEAMLQLGEAGLKGALSTIITTATGVISIYEGLGEKFAETNGLTAEQYQHLTDVAGALQTVSGAAGGIAALTAALWLANVAQAAFNATARLNPYIAIAGLGAAAIGGIISSIHAQKREHEAFMTSANNLEEQNLKIKQQIAKVAGISAAPNPSKTARAAAVSDLEILVKQRTVLEASIDANKTAVAEQKKASEAAEQARAKALQLAQAHNAVTTSSVAETKASKQSIDESKKRAETISKSITEEFRSLDEQHKKLTLSERDYYASTSAVKDMDFAHKSMALAIWDSNKALEAQLAANDKAKTAMDTLIDQYNRLTLSARDYYATTLKRDGITPEKSAPLLQQFDKNSALEAQKKQIDDTRRSLDSYNSSLESAKGNLADLGLVSLSVFDGALGGVSAMAGAFSTMTTSINGNIKALDELHKKQLENANFKSDPAASVAQIAKDKQFIADNTAKYAKQEADLTAKNTALAVAGSRQIVGATAMMFKEGSKERKVAHGIEAALATVEMAMSTKKMFVELFGIKAVTIAQTESVGPTVAASFTKGSAKAAEAVATQASAGPYIGFALMAAMAAAMAAIGFSVGGGGGGTSVDVVKDRQTATGTGSVLGDAEAKSESIAKSIDLLKRNSDIELPLTQGMLTSLRNIENGIGGLGSLLSRTIGGSYPAVAGLGKTNNYPIPTFIDPVAKIDPISNFLISGLFGSVKKSLLDYGIFAKQQTLESIRLNGFVAQQYVDIEKKSEALFGLISSTSRSRQLSQIDTQTTDQFGKIILNLSDTVGQAAQALGTNSAEFKARMRGFIINLGSISLKDLKGEDLQKQLEAIFGKVGDDMARAGFSGLTEFQKVGEGYFETLVRVATGVDQASNLLDKFGLTAINYTNILNKQGDVAAEIVRQTIAGSEKAGSGIQKIIETFDGSAQDMVDFTKKLLDIRKQLLAVNLGSVDVGVPLIKGGGGTDSLAGSLSTYQDKFFSDAEKVTAQLRAMSTAFSDLGIYLPASRDGFRALVEGIDTSTEAGRTLLGHVLQLADGFDTLTTSSDSLLSRLRDNVVTAYNNEASLLQKQIDNYRGFANQLKSFSDSLVTGNLSTASPEQKYATSKAAFEGIKTTLATGTTAEKETALGKLQTVTQQYLDASRGYNASGVAYVKDYTAAQALLAASIQGSSDKADIAQTQLDRLTDQVTALGLINQSVQSVKDAVDALKLATVKMNEARAADAEIARQNINKAAFNKIETARKTAYEAPINNLAAGRGSWAQKTESSLGWSADTSRAAFSAEANIKASSGDIVGGEKYQSSSGHSGEVVANLKENGFHRVRQQFGNIGHLIESIVGGTLPDVYVKLSAGADPDPGQAMYTLAGKSQSVRGDNIDPLVRLFANDATDYLADQMANKDWADQIKKVGFSSIGSGISELSALMSHLKNPFKAQEYNAAKDYTKIDGSHRSGLERVPFDGYVAELHKDERVLTANESAAYNQQTINNQTVANIGGSAAYNQQTTNTDSKIAHLINKVSNPVNNQQTSSVQMAGDISSQTSSNLAFTNWYQSVVDGSHRAGLESVPFDGYVAELHKGERVLTAPESAAYNSQTINNQTVANAAESVGNTLFTTWYQSLVGGDTSVNAPNSAAVQPGADSVEPQRMDIAISRPAWLDELKLPQDHNPKKSAASGTDKEVIEQLKKQNAELSKQTKAMQQNIQILQAGFNKLVEQGAKQVDSLDDIQTRTRTRELAR